MSACRCDSLWFCLAPQANKLHPGVYVSPDHFENARVVVNAVDKWKLSEGLTGHLMRNVRFGDVRLQPTYEVQMANLRALFVILKRLRNTYVSEDRLPSRRSSVVTGCASVVHHASSRRHVQLRRT